MATKLERGGGKALVAGPLKKTFFAASLSSMGVTEYISFLLKLKCKHYDLLENEYEP